MMVKKKFQEAILMYDKALQLNPKFRYSWVKVINHI